MRRFSRQYVLVNEEKYYLVSVKADYRGWEPVAFFKKKTGLGPKGLQFCKDEHGIMVEEKGQLFCPHRNELSELAWWPLPDSWINVPSICKKCWGSHRQPNGRFNCILRSLQIKQYQHGKSISVDKEK